MRFIALLIGKSILKGLRTLGRSGSALPGLVIEKMQPHFLHDMLKQLPEGVIIVTGTNGKTTTTKMIASLLEAHGKKVLTNRTGSNFVRGIVTTVVDKASFSGNLAYDVAVFEQDEAHAVHFVHQVKPRGVVVLNIMRDQMDRFGEIDTTAQLLQKVVSSATEWAILNANDERVARLTPSEPAQIVWYGHAKALQDDFLTDDQFHHDDKTTYTCAGKMRTELLSFKDDSVTIAQNERKTVYKSPISGSHNAINLTAALAALEVLVPEDDPTITHAAVSRLEPAFGRGETIHIKNGAAVTLQLVKNPGGFTHALRTLAAQPYTTVGISINDDYADGRDVSWLWDVDFQILSSFIGGVICGGTRAADMAVRLKYDEVSAREIQPELADFVQEIVSTLDQTDTAIIFCTYTAMLRIRKLLTEYADDIYEVRV